MVMSVVACIALAFVLMGEFLAEKVVALVAPSFEGYLPEPTVYLAGSYFL